MRWILPLLLLAGFARSAPLEIETPRGAKLQADLHVPKTANGTGVVIAPGQGYHRGLPLIVRSAERLADAGFTVVRFDWAYFTAKQGPSPAFATELKDLDAVIAHLRKRAGIGKILVAGKSLGSLVATMRAAKKSDDLAGVALLTFPIHAPNRPTQRFDEAKELAKVKVPTFIVAGNKDPLCGTKALYELAATLPRPPEIVIVPGDHSLKEDTDAKRDENIDLAVRAFTVWAKRASE